MEALVRFYITCLFNPHFFVTVLHNHSFVAPQKNVKDVMDSNGVRIMVDLLTLAHLHTSRATVPLQVITIAH